jgi:hypothetical protein
MLYFLYTVFVCISFYILFYSLYIGIILNSMCIDICKNVININDCSFLCVENIIENLSKYNNYF